MFPKKGFLRKKCEDCHTVNKSLGAPNGPYDFFDFPEQNFSLRKDYDLSELQVYFHLELLNKGAGCLSYDPETGEGVCHGISIEYGENFGGFFMFNASTDRKFLKDDPYLRTILSDNLPDTKDCLFCHNQGDTTITTIWGNPQQIQKADPVEAHINSKANSECYECHVKGSIAPENFHSSVIYVERPKLIIEGEPLDATEEPISQGREDKDEEKTENIVFQILRGVVSFIRSLISRVI
jgi:hypothetical protein